MPNFIWTIKNNLPNPIHLHDVGEKGIFLMKGEVVHLHDRYRLDVLLASDCLDRAIKKGLVEVVQREDYVPEPIEIVPNKEFSSLKKEISELKNALSNRPIMTTSVSGLRKEDIVELFEEFKKNEDQKTKEVLSELLKESLSGISVLSTDSSTNNNGEKFQELSPEEVSAQYLTNKEKLSEGTSIKNKSKIKETIEESVIDDTLNILEKLGGE